MSIYSQDYSEHRYIGKTFNKLLVISVAKEEYREVSYRKSKLKITHYNCLCQCGNTTIVSQSAIKGTKSCGCARIESNKLKAFDITGQVFGRLTVKSKLDVGNVWLCLCECGTEKVTNVSSLVSGNTRSCGCLYIESSSKQGLISVKKYRVSQGYDEDFLMSPESKLERNKSKPFIKAALSRDYFRCAWCDNSRLNSTLEVHHLVPWAKNKDLRFEMSNLVCLCKGCHTKIHQSNHSGPVDEIMTILLQGFVIYQEEIKDAEEYNVNLFIS